MEHFETYQWRGYQCAYSRYDSAQADSPYALMTIHPVGVGLSRHFWDRFCHYWQTQQYPGTIYSPDLLGCGDSDRPHVAYYPEDWAAQLEYVLTHVIQQPTVLLIQGALFSIAIQLLQQLQDQTLVRGLALSGPPGWPLITQVVSAYQPKLLWNLFFDTPIGNGFFRYARREQFLRSFSQRQLFASEQDIDEEWLTVLQQGAAMDNRYAVFAFLAGFWRRDYTAQIEAIQQPTLVLLGNEASGIDRVSRMDDAKRRLQNYLEHLPNGTGKLVPGRNVLPYESTTAFADVLIDWLLSLR